MKKLNESRSWTVKQEQYVVVGGGDEEEVDVQPQTVSNKL